MHTALAHLSDAELLRHAENSYDDLTSTVLEIELTERFKNLLDGWNEPLYQMLLDSEIESVKDLQDVIEKADKFDELRESVADLATQLKSVTNLEQ